MRYAIVNNNQVKNIIEWDGISPYNCQDVLVQIQEVKIGDKYENNKFYTYDSELEQWIEIQ